MTDNKQPYIEIREVDIGEPFQKWYQAPKTPSEATLDPPKSNFYQYDKRSYEFFTLDGVDWTKQLRGNALDMNITRLVSNIQNTVKERYDLINNNCHGTREKLFPAADNATGRENIDQQDEIQHEAGTHELPKFAIPDHILRGESKLTSDIGQARRSESHRRAQQANQHRSTFARAGSNTYQETKSGNSGKALLGLGGLLLGGLTIYATGGAAAVVVLPQAGGGGVQIAASFAILL